MSNVKFEALEALGILGGGFMPIPDVERSRLNDADKVVIDRYNTENRWGLQVCIDLHNCNSVTIRSQDDIHMFAEELVKFIDMKAYGRPQIVRFGEDDRVAGYTLVQLIETSCITAHFSEDTDRAFIDVFSCKSFPPCETAKFCQSFFGAEKGTFKVLFRD